MDAWLPCLDKIVSLQLLAHYIAVRRGRDNDQTVDLAKSLADEQALITREIACAGEGICSGEKTGVDPKQHWP